MTERWLTLDPGVTTGYCIAVPEGDTRLFIAYGEARLEVEDVMDLLMDVSPSNIICEDFEFRQRARLGLELFSVQLIGIVRYYERTRFPSANPPQEVKLYMQKAAQGKSYFSDTELKRLEIYQKGLAHGRDACRHFMQWYTFGPGYQFNKEPELRVVEMEWLVESYLQVYWSEHKWLGG